MEVEVKYRVSSLEEIEKRLKKLGAKFLGEFRETDIYFQHPCRNMARTDEALRLRVVNGECEFTYKGPRSSIGIKSREEITVKIDSVDRMLEILSRLGFRSIARLTKLRCKYVLNNCVISLDQIDNLGSFVEIEALDEVEDPLKTILDTIELLQLKGAVIEKTYLELLLEDNENI